MHRVLSIFVLLGLLSLCAATCDYANFANGSVYAGTFTRCESLNDHYDLYWNIKDNNLTVGVHLANIQNGWVGFGISLNGGMRGADITVVQYDTAAGKWKIDDRFVPGSEGMPKVDDHQDATLLHASSDTSGSTVVFSRSVIPCDVVEDKPILKDGTQVIFAYGQTFGYHNNNRGSKTIFFHYVEVDSTLPSDAESFDIVAAPYEMPAQETTYACSALELPKQDEKHHIIRWRPIVQPGNEMYVHHILVFVCSSVQTNTTTYECGMAPTNCNNIMLAWSLGQYGDDWKYNYALPIGGDNGYKHVVLQVHYNNIARTAGIMDASGLRITYTKAVKTYDIGSMILSTKFTGLIIPPQQQAFEKWGECPTECTSKLDRPIQLVNYFPHMHQVGVKIWVQHIRNGTELPEIHRDDNYDFQRQQSYAMNITVLPGDRIRLHCVWNTMSRTENTIGGEASLDEMCAGYFQYYPSQVDKFTTCSNFELPGSRAVCGPNNAIVVMAPYGNYTALPPVESTCVDPSPSPSSSPSPTPSSSPSPSPSPTLPASETDSEGAAASMFVNAALVFVLALVTLF